MAIVEFIGFAGRAASASQKAGCWTLTPYLIQSMFLLLAPAMFAASIYMVLGRVILLVDGEVYALIRRRWLTKIFVTGDVICFLLLGGGTYLAWLDLIPRPGALSAPEA